MGQPQPDFREVVSFIMPRTSSLIVVISFVTVCIAGSASAQESLERAKTAAQLYATNCARCHKSPQSVTTTTKIFGRLESFLREHYTPSSQSAATIAAYLNGLEKQSSGSLRARDAKRTSRTNAAKPSPNETSEDKSSVERTLNSAAETAERTLDRLLQAIKPEKN
jgi:cytochrome c553